MLTSRLSSEDLNRLVGQFKSLNELKNSRIHVTGCNGFIPGALMDLFFHLKSELNLILSGTCRDPNQAQTKWANQVLAIRHDQPAPEADFYFHGASPANPGNFHKVDELIFANVTMTQSLLNFKKGRLVFFSTGEIYGKGHTKPIQENELNPIDPENPYSSYALSKLMGENLCVNAAKVGQWTKVARIFHTYGPGLRLHDGRIQNDLIGDAVDKKSLILKSDGSAIRSMSYITDTIAGILTLALKPTSYTVFNVGNTKGEVTILQFAQALAKLTGLEVQHEAKAPTVDRVAGNYSVPNTSRLANLGWQPLVGLHEGLDRTLRSFNVT